MLIVTNRHTKKDLEIYEEYRQLDKIIKIKKEKINLSIEIIRAWKYNYKNDCVCMTSWGKDSIVLLHLIVLSKIDIKVVYMRPPHANPDCDIVKNIFLSNFNIDYNEEIYTNQELDLHGKDWHWHDIANKYGKYRITGLRNDESGRRKMSYKINGHNTKHSCRPLALWKNAEIFGYIEQNNLPLNPVYGYLGGGKWDRKHIRTHSIGGNITEQIREWEKEYYMDVLNKMHQKKKD